MKKMQVVMSILVYAIYIDYAYASYGLKKLPRNNINSVQEKSLSNLQQKASNGSKVSDSIKVQQATHRQNEQSVPQLVLAQPLKKELDVSKIGDFFREQNKNTGGANYSNRMAAPIKDYVASLVKNEKFQQIAQQIPEILSTYALEFINKKTYKLKPYEPQEFAEFPSNYIESMGFRDWLPPKDNASLANLYQGLRFLNEMLKKPEFTFSLNSSLPVEPFVNYVAALRKDYPLVPDKVLAIYVKKFFENPPKDFLEGKPKDFKITPTDLVQETTKKLLNDLYEAEDGFSDSNMNDLQKIYITMTTIQNVNAKYKQFLSDVKPSESLSFADTNDKNQVAVPFNKQLSLDFSKQQALVPVQAAPIPTPVVPPASQYVAEGFIPKVDNSLGNIKNLYDVFAVPEEPVDQGFMEALGAAAQESAQNLSAMAGFKSDPVLAKIPLEVMTPTKAADVKNAYIHTIAPDTHNDFQKGENALIQLNKDIAVAKIKRDRYLKFTPEHEKLENLIKIAEDARKQIINDQIQDIMSSIKLVDISSLESLQEKYKTDLNEIEGGLSKILPKNTSQKLVADQTQAVYKSVELLLSTVKVIANALEGSKEITVKDLELEKFDNPHLLLETKTSINLTGMEEQCRLLFLEINKYHNKISKLTIDNILTDMSKNSSSNFKDLVKQQLEFNKKATALEKQKAADRDTQSTEIANKLWDDYQRKIVEARGTINVPSNPVKLALEQLKIALQIEDLHPALDATQKQEQQDAIDNLSKPTIRINNKDVPNSTEILMEEMSKLQATDIFKDSQAFKMYRQVIEKLENNREIASNIQLTARELFANSKKLPIDRIISMLEDLDRNKGLFDTSENINFNNEVGVEIPSGMDIPTLIAELQRKQSEMPLGLLAASTNDIGTNLVQGNMLGTASAAVGLVGNIPGALVEGTYDASNRVRLIFIDVLGQAQGNAAFAACSLGLANIMRKYLYLLVAINSNQNLTDDEKYQYKLEATQAAAVDQANYLTAALTGADQNIVAGGNAESIATSGLFNNFIQALTPGMQQATYNPGAALTDSLDNFQTKYNTILTQPAAYQTSNTSTNYSSYSPSHSSTYTSYTPSTYTSSTYTPSSYASKYQTTTPSYNTPSTYTPLQSYTTSAPSTAPSPAYTPVVKTPRYRSPLLSSTQVTSPRLASSVTSPILDHSSSPAKSPTSVTAFQPIHNVSVSPTVDTSKIVIPSYQDILANIRNDHQLLAHNS